MRYLYILPGPVYPPSSGPQNLTFGLLSSAAEGAACDIIGFSTSEEEDSMWKQLPAVLPAVTIVQLVRLRSGLGRRLSRLAHLVRGLPVSLAKYENRFLHLWLRERLKECRYDLVHFDSFNVSMYRRDCGMLPTLLVPPDAYSLRARRGLDLARGIRMRAAYLWKHAAYRRFEVAAYPHFTLVCPVSEVDSAWLRRIEPSIRTQTVGIPIAQEFAYSASLQGAKSTTPTVICAGYFAEDLVSEGGVEFLEQVYPTFKELAPRAKVVFWGTTPTRRLSSCLEQHPGVQYVGHIDDYKAFLQSATIYVLPQRSGSGIQTKVQQAMAVGLPVVARPHVLAALGASPGVHALASKTNEEMAQDIARLIEKPEEREQIGRAASAFIWARFGPNVVAAQLRQAYATAMAVRRSEPQSEWATT